MTDAKIEVQLGPIQETLLIPLLGRAYETRRENGLIDDPRSVEIVESLDYDFDKWREQDVAGASLRTRMFDHLVEDFLAEHPDATVVEIGSGLNTRFERVDNGRVRWFDLDLPDTIALRRRFFEDTDRRTMIAASVLDTDWMDAVHATGGPWMFVSEAVMIYLEAADARRVFEQIGARFEHFSLLTDTVSRSMISRQGKGGAMKQLPKTSWFRWECDDPREVEGWLPGLQLVASRSFVDARPELIARMPSPFGPLVRWVPWLVRWMLKGYWLNHFSR